LTYSFAIAANIPRGNVGLAFHAPIHRSCHPDTVDGMAKTAVIAHRTLPASTVDRRIGTTVRASTKFEFASASRIEPCRS
jgi:hypothetical protein